MIRSLLAASAPLLLSTGLAAAGGLGPVITVPGAAPVLGAGAVAVPGAVAPVGSCGQLEAALDQLSGQGWSNFAVEQQGGTALVAATRGSESARFSVTCDPAQAILTDDDEASEGRVGQDDG